MKKTLVISSLIALTCAGNLRAQDSKQALADELTKLMNIQGQLQKTIDVLKQTMPAQMEQTRAAMGVTNAPPGSTDDFNKTMDAIFAAPEWKELEHEMAAIYADTFSEDELKGIIEFYKSPAGQAFIQKQPEIMKRSMAINQKMMLTIMPRLQEIMKQSKTANAPAASTP